MSRSVWDPGQTAPYCCWGWRYHLKNELERPRSRKFLSIGTVTLPHLNLYPYRHTLQLQQHVLCHSPMDELVFPASSSSCPSPASFSNAGHHQEHEFVPCDVLEGWLGGDDWLDEPPNGVKVTWGGEGSRSPGNDHLSGEPAAPALKRRGRKPGSRNNINGPALCPVEAERQRRDKLNRLFCELRAAVPTVSRMDKASVLADATTYIAQLRQRVEQLEADAKKKAAAAALTTVAPSHSFSSSSSLGEKLEVRMVGTEAAALRLTTTAAARHAPARLMLALRSLDLTVSHACVCLVGGMTVQDAVVEVPAALRDDRALRAALLHRLQRTS